MNPLRVAVAGATGRMGQELVRRISAAADLHLVAAVSLPEDSRLGQDAGRVAGLADLGVTVTPELAADCDVMVEFTVPAAAVHWARRCADRGIPLVSGTTGLSTEQAADLRRAAARVAVVHAPNMSIGVNLLSGLVRELAQRLGLDWDVEIVETHHRRKIDAPSGTAQALLQAVLAARRAGAGGADKASATVFGRQGETGARPPGQIGVHAVRMGAIVGEHEVHFTSDDESLLLRHRAFSRSTFAAGALQAARWIVGRPPGLYTMQDVLLA